MCPLGNPGPSAFQRILEKVRALEIPLSAKQQHKPKPSRDFITLEFLDMSPNLRPSQLSILAGKWNNALNVALGKIRTQGKHHTGQFDMKY